MVNKALNVVIVIDVKGLIDLKTIMTWQHFNFEPPYSLLFNNFPLPLHAAFVFLFASFPINNVPEKLYLR